MTKNQGEPKVPYVMILWGILLGLFIISFIYRYIFNNRPPSKFEYQLFGLVSGIIFAIMGGIGVYFRDMGKYIKGKPAIVIGIFFIFLGITNIVCYWSAVFR